MNFSIMVSIIVTLAANNATHVQAAVAQPLLLATEDYRPYNMPGEGQDTVTGYSVDMLRELMKRSGTDYQMKLFPWKRAMNVAANDPNACVFSTARYKEREHMFKWVGPLVKNYSWTIFGRSDDKRSIRSLTDLRPYVMGSYADGAAAEFLISHGFKTDLADTDGVNPSKLLHGRFDFWAAGTSHGKSILEKQGLSQKISPKFQFFRGALYLACNRNMPKSRIDEFNRILHDMDRDGSASAIENQYFQN